MNPPSPEVFFTTVSGDADEPAICWAGARGLLGELSKTPAVPATSAGQLIPGRRDQHARVSIVFSFWNEEDVLPELIRRVRAVFEELVANGEVGGYEMVFVNDASTDRSEQILREEALRRDDIRIVNMSRNFGVSPCVLAGMLYASGDAVIYMDADLQDPPEIIPELIRTWQANPQVDVVHTVRRVRLGESRTKRLLTRLGYATLRATANLDLPHEAGDFKLLSRRAVDQVVRHREKRPFMRGLVCSVGFKQERVYYDRQPRVFGETKFPVLGWKVLGNFFDSAVISFSDLPLKLAGLLGVLFTFAGTCWIAGLLLAAVLGYGVPGWSAALAGIVWMGGLQLFCLGILGSYLGGIYFETKGRPNFIVRDTFGFE